MIILLQKIEKYFSVLSSINELNPNLVLVVGVVVTQVSYQPNEVGLEADDRRLVSISTEGGEVLCRTENILAGLPDGMHLLQELYRERVKGEKRKGTQSMEMKFKPLDVITLIMDYKLSVDNFTLDMLFKHQVFIWIWIFHHFNECLLCTKSPKDAQSDQQTQVGSERLCECEF